MSSPPFTLFSPAHLVALVAVAGLTAIPILLLIRYRDTIEFQKWYPWLAFLLVINAAYWKFSVIILNNLSWAVNLPLHFCGVAPYLLAIYLLWPHQKLFDVLFYWVIVGSVAALLLPDFLENDFVGFFFLHGFPLLILLFLIILRGIRPSPGSFWTAFLWLNIYAFVIAAPLDLITGANYVFLREPPNVNFGPIKLLPPWPWYIPVIDGFLLIVYWLIYQLSLVQPKAKKSTELVDTS